MIYSWFFPNPFHSPYDIVWSHMTRFWRATEGNHADVIIAALCTCSFTTCFLLWPEPDLIPAIYEVPKPLPKLVFHLVLPSPKSYLCGFYSENLLWNACFHRVEVSGYRYQRYLEILQSCLDGRRRYHNKRYDFFYYAHTSDGAFPWLHSFYSTYGKYVNNLWSDRAFLKAHLGRCSLNFLCYPLMWSETRLDDVIFSSHWAPARAEFRSHLENVYYTRPLDHLRDNSMISYNISLVTAPTHAPDLTKLFDGPSLNLIDEPTARPLPPVGNPRLFGNRL